MTDNHADAVAKQQQQQQEAAKQQHEAAKNHAEDAKKRIGEERKAREEAVSRNAKMVSEVKPTPTQEEADLAASGVYLAEHEPDGSTDPTVPQDKDKQSEQYKNKQSEAGKPTTRAAYQTRSSGAE